MTRVSHRVLQFSRMYHSVIFLVFCIVPFSASADVSADEIMSHKNWKFLPKANECGQNRQKASRIVGGQKAQFGRFPWFARLGYSNSRNQSLVDFRCGASLINERFVLTAAHCVKGMEKTLRVVRLGENLPQMPEDCTDGRCTPYVKDFSVEETIMHPDFNISSYKADIALIRLGDKVNFSGFIQPICLPRDKILQQSFFGEKFTVIGWGREQASSEDLSKFLRYVDVPMRDLCACASIYSTISLDESQLCVGLDDGKDSCDGDSGGPLIWVQEVGVSQIHIQTGLVSFGSSYCGENPSIYTSIIYYMPWILDNVYDAGYNEINGDGA